MINLKSKLGLILSRREIEVVTKRLDNIPITQTESNYLSRSIRPKLKSAAFATKNNLLRLLDYKRKKYERKDLILNKMILLALKDILRDVQAVIIFGSYIMNRHTNYQDIDIMVVLKRRLWKGTIDKFRLEKNIESRIHSKTDINFVVYKDLKQNFQSSPLLQTQLEYSKSIYGKINLNKAILINEKYLYAKLLDIETVIELGKDLEGKYIYNGIRGCLAIELFLKKIINNRLIINRIKDDIGESTMESLRKNTANKIQRDIGLRYLKYLYKTLEKKLRVK